MPPLTEQGPVWSLTDALLEIPSGGSITNVDIFYARSVQPNPDTNTITFEGDDTSQEVEEVTRWALTLICDKHDYEVIQKAYGKPLLTGISGEAWRMGMGDDDEVAGAQVGLRYTLKYKDESVSPPVVGEIGYHWPLGQMKVVQPQQAEWKAKNTVQLNFIFQKTLVDAAGDPLPGNPTKAAPYFIYKKS